jgi:hypothetical protein
LSASEADMKSQGAVVAPVIVGNIARKSADCEVVEAVAKNDEVRRRQLLLLLLVGENRGLFIQQLGLLHELHDSGMHAYKFVEEHSPGWKTTAAAAGTLTSTESCKTLY